MKLNIITLATVKIQLGLSDTTSDADITAMIPLVSSDVRRILNDNFDKYINATITSGSTDINIDFDSYKYNYIRDRLPLPLGQVVYNPNIPDDTYLESFDPDTNIYTLSTGATANGDYIYPTLLVAQWPTVSKMIWYKISTKNTTDAKKKGIASESYGPVSKSYSASEINKQYNYPQQLINDLGIVTAMVD